MIIKLCRPAAQYADPGDAMRRRRNSGDKALETMEVYAPIGPPPGHQGEIKEELEDRGAALPGPRGLTMRLKTIRELLHKHERQKFLAHGPGTASPGAYWRKTACRGPSTRPGRVKSIYGIYRKVYMQGRAFRGDLRHLRGAASSWRLCP